MDGDSKPSSRKVRRTTPGSPSFRSIVFRQTRISRAPCSTKKPLPRLPRRSWKSVFSSPSSCGKPKRVSTHWLPANDAGAQPGRLASRRSRPSSGRDDRSLLTEALVENLQREDLSALEEATAYQELLEDFGLTHEEVGNRVGKSRSAITNSLRLLQLPAAIQGKLERGELSAGHARALLGLEDKKFAEHIAERAAEEGWSVRQVEDAVRSRNQAVAEPHTGRRNTPARPAAIVELEQRLRDQLSTRVKIKYANDRGKLVIDFSSLDDLERIYRQFFSA